MADELKFYDKVSVCEIRQEYDNKGGFLVDYIEVAQIFITQPVFKNYITTINNKRVNRREVEFTARQESVTAFDILPFKFVVLIGDVKYEVLSIKNHSPNYGYATIKCQDILGQLQ